MRFPFIRLFLLMLPFLEIASFVVVGRQIGVLPTIGLVIATGVAGSILLRVQGFGIMTRIRAEMAAGRSPSRELAHGAMILLAGLLLFIPGFVSDIVGVLLFIPPIRDFAWRFLKARISVKTGFAGFGGFARSSPGPRGQTIDLDEDEYSTRNDADSPWRRIDRD